MLPHCPALLSFCSVIIIIIIIVVVVVVVVVVTDILWANK